MGLFAGISVITIFELIEYPFVKAYLIFKRNQQRSTHGELKTKKDKARILSNNNDVGEKVVVPDMYTYRVEEHRQQAATMGIVTKQPRRKSVAFVVGDDQVFLDDQPQPPPPSYATFTDTIKY